jgi:hypothetical protein
LLFAVNANEFGTLGRTSRHVENEGDRIAKGP